MVEIRFRVVRDPHACQIDRRKFPLHLQRRRGGLLFGFHLLLERAREIKALGVHPKYPLKVNGVLIGVYTADFVYFEGGRQIVEDVKGIVTPEASLRMRVFMALYPTHELRIVDRKGGWERFKQRAVTARAA